MTAQAPLERGRLGVSDYAVERYRTFYPEAIGRDMLDAIEVGIEAEWETAWAFTGRKGRPDPGNRYVVHPERTGLFVIRCEPRTHWDHVVTFLRFYSLEQHEVAARLWPGGRPVTARASWVDTPNLPPPEVQEAPGDAPPALSTQPKARPPRAPKPSSGGRMPPLRHNEANRWSRPGGVAVLAIGATAIHIHADDFDAIGGFETLDRLAAGGAIRRTRRDGLWIAHLGHDTIVLAPRTAKRTRFACKLVRNNVADDS